MEANKQGNIGTLAQAVIAAARSPQTGSAQQCAPWQGSAPALRLPSTVEEADRLMAWAMSVPVRQEPCDVSAIAVQIDYMRAALPSRAVDEEDGKKRLAVYVRLLREFSEPALAHMARRACAELDWFPTPRWCVEAARSYRSPASQRDTALALCRRFRQQVFTEWLRSLRDGTATQEEIDTASYRHRLIAEEQGLLRWDKQLMRHSATRKPSQ